MEMIDMSEDEADYLKYRFKQYLGSVSREIQNRKLKEQKMGRLIDANKELIELKKMKVVDDEDKQSIRFAILEFENAPTVEAIPKADYEARLKADMVAMLTDIQISVAELDFSWMCDYADGDCIKRYAVVDIIQEKINALKGDQ